MRADLADCGELDVDAELVSRRPAISRIIDHAWSFDHVLLQRPHGPLQQPAEEKPRRKQDSQDQQGSDSTSAQGLNPEPNGSEPAIACGHGPRAMALSTSLV